MPKIVDHEQRREEIARHTVAVIARKGIQTLTLRDIAREAGTTIGVLGHYFTSRADLIEFTFQYFCEQLLEVQRRAASSGAGLAVLRASAGIFVEPRWRDTLPAILGYWAHAHATPKLRRLHRKFYSDWVEIVATGLRRAIRTREIPASVDVEAAAEAYVSLSEGLAIRVILDGKRMPPARAHDMLSDFVDRLGKSRDGKR